MSESRVTLCSDQHAAQPFDLGSAGKVSMGKNTRRSCAAGAQAPSGHSGALPSCRQAAIYLLNNKFGIQESKVGIPTIPIS